MVYIRDTTTYPGDYYKRTLSAFLANSSGFRTSSPTSRSSLSEPAAGRAAGSPGPAALRQNLGQERSAPAAPASCPALVPPGGLWAASSRRLQRLQPRNDPPGCRQGLPAREPSARAAARHLLGAERCERPGGQEGSGARQGARATPPRCGSSLREAPAQPKLFGYFFLKRRAGLRGRGHGAGSLRREGPEPLRRAGTGTRGGDAGRGHADATPCAPRTPQVPAAPSAPLPALPRR